MSTAAQGPACPSTDEEDVEIEIAIQCDEIIQQQARHSVPVTTPQARSVSP
jgi:hypothetical protein